MADLIAQGIVDNIINTKTFRDALKNLPIETIRALEEVLDNSISQGLGINQIVINVTEVLVVLKLSIGEFKVTITRSDV